MRARVVAQLFYKYSFGPFCIGHIGNELYAYSFFYMQDN